MLQCEGSFLASNAYADCTVDGVNNKNGINTEIGFYIFVCFGNSN